MSVWFRHCEVTLSVFPYCAFSKEVTMHSPHFRRRCIPCPVGQNVYINYLDICTRDGLFSLIYLINRLIMWTYGYFILWVIIQYYIFLLRVVQLCPLGALSPGPCALWHPHPPALWVDGFFFFFLSTSLLSGTTGYSRLIVYISDPSLRISLSSKEPWFLLLENIIRNQYLGGRFAHCCWSVITSGLSADRARR